MYNPNRLHKLFFVVSLHRRSGNVSTAATTCKSSSTYFVWRWANSYFLSGKRIFYLPFFVFLSGGLEPQRRRRCFGEVNRHDSMSVMVGCAPVWPDLGKICHFGKSLQVFGKFLAAYSLFGKMLSLLWQICDIIGLNFIVANGQILKNNSTIWSHWLCHS